MSSLKPNANTLQQVQHKWQLKSELKFVRKVENWIYYAEQEKIYVRIANAEHKKLEHIASELDFLDHLKKQNVNFAHPIKNQNQNYIEIIEQEFSLMYVTVFQEAVGSDAFGKLTDLLIENWGKSMAHIHVASKIYQPSIHITRRGHWNSNPVYDSMCLELKNWNKTIFNLAQEAHKILDQFPKERNDYGLCHMDFHFGNFSVNQQSEIIVFDFDDSLHNWYVYDATISFLYINDESYQGSQKHFEQTFWRGYEQVAKINPFFKEKIEFFKLYRLIEMYCWCSKNKTNETIAEKVKIWINNKILQLEDQIIRHKSNLDI